MAHQPLRQRLVTYGGRSGAAQAWAYNGAWSQLCSGCAPGARIGHGMATDPVTGELLLFGGSKTENYTLACSELWRGDGVDWALVETSGDAPPAAWLRGLALDEGRGRLVVFGGQDTNGVLLGDVHELDRSVWHAAPAPAQRPSHRLAPAMTFHPGDGRVWMYGGRDSSGPTDDLWAWDGATWQRLCLGCTGRSRSHATLFYFPPDGELYLNNGWTGSDEIPGTWRYQDGAFVQIADLPPKRDSQAVAYDPSRRRLVLFGGNGDSCGGDCGETWEFGLAP